MNGDNKKCKNRTSRPLKQKSLQELIHKDPEKIPLLIIDEVSNLIVDKIAQLSRLFVVTRNRIDEPFGGMKLLFVGPKVTNAFLRLGPMTCEICNRLIQGVRLQPFSALGVSPPHMLCAISVMTWKLVIVPISIIHHRLVSLLLALLPPSHLFL